MVVPFVFVGPLSGWLLDAAGADSTGAAKCVEAVDQTAFGLFAGGSAESFL